MTTLPAVAMTYLLALALIFSACNGPYAKDPPADDGSRAPHDAKPLWSPDGTRLVFHRGEERALYTLDVHSRSAHKLLEGVAWSDGYAWSPDGKWLAATSRRDGVTSPRCYGLEPCPELYVVPAVGGSPRRLTENRTDEQVPRWSPDGRHIAFFSTHPPGDPHTWRDVSLVDVHTGVERRLTDTPAVEHDMRWEKDGQALVVATDRGSRFRLFRDGGREELEPGRVPPFVGLQHPAGRSRNGSVAYLSDRDANGRTCYVDYGRTRCSVNRELYLRRADGRRERITHSRVDERDYSWSPDGQSLAFSSGGWLWLVDADGSGLRRLTGGAP